MGLTHSLLAEKTKIVIKRSATLQKFLEITLADLNRTHTLRDGHTLVACKQRTVMIQLTLITETLDDQQTETAEIHHFEVEITYHICGEVMTCHIKEKSVGRNIFRREQQDEIVRLFGGEYELNLPRITVGGRVIGKTDVPEHTAHIRTSATQFASLRKPFEI